MPTDISSFRDLYPFESHWLDLDGLRLHYIDEGAGDPVVMVHGNPTWSFYFRELVKQLRLTHRAVALDHIGCGLSDKPDDKRYEYTLRRRVEDLETLLDHLGLDANITFVLHDWGGMIGATCALRRLERVKRVVFLNTAAFLLPAGRKLPWQLSLLRNVPPLATVLVRGLNAFTAGATRMATAKGLPKDVKQAYLAPYDCWASRIATLRFVQDIPLKPGDPSYELAKWTDDNLARLRDLPIFIGWGEHDFVFDRHFLAEWERRLPNAEIHRFPDADHYVLEDAADELIPRICNFIREPATVAAGTGAGRCGTGFQPVNPPAGSRSHKERGAESCATYGAPTVNIAERLSEMAERYPDKRAVVCCHGPGETNTDCRSITFAQLDQQVDSYAAGLSRIGVTRGMRTIVMVRPSIELFTLTFALFKIGAVPVLIDPGMGRQNLVKCLANVDAEAFIGIPLAHVLRVLHRGAFASVRIMVTVGRRWLWGGHTLNDLEIRSQSANKRATHDAAPTTAADTAAILFTSGSTGPAKGVVYTHGVFDAQVRFLDSHFGYGPDEVDLATFPLFALFDAALGMTAVIPDMDASRPGSVDPRAIIGAIRGQGCTHMFGSPALLDRVSRHGVEHGVMLPTLKRVITAGAPIQPAILERVHRMLPDDAEVFTPYGATESLPVSSIGSREILGETQHATARGGGTCVGRPLAGMDVHVIRITDEPIATWNDTREMPTGEIGEIVVRGPVVTHEYFKHDEATELAKIRDGDTIWHRMGDVGYFDGQGRLWFCGRKAHRVATDHGTLFTVPCEAIFNQHPRVRRSALVGVGKPGDQRPIICIELEPGEADADDDGLVEELIELARAHEHTREIDMGLFHPSFPVDVRHNAKIFREKLAVWAAEQLK